MATGALCHRPAVMSTEGACPQPLALFVSPHISIGVCQLHPQRLFVRLQVEAQSPAQGHFSRTAAALQECRSCRRQDDADADLLALVQNITQLVLKCPGPSFTTLHRAEISPNWCQMVLK